MAYLRTSYRVAKYFDRHKYWLEQFFFRVIKVCVSEKGEIECIIQCMIFCVTLIGERKGGKLYFYIGMQRCTAIFKIN